MTEMVFQGHDVPSIKLSCGRGATITAATNSSCITSLQLHCSSRESRAVIKHTIVPSATLRSGSYGKESRDKNSNIFRPVHASVFCSKTRTWNFKAGYYVRSRQLNAVGGKDGLKQGT